MGSPLRVLYESGRGEVYGYDEFGRETSFEGRYSRQGEKQPFGYTGYRYDVVGGTYFAQAREYQPAYGRFLAEDRKRGRAAIPKTRNRYGYCWNNPVGMVDLNGMEPEVPGVEIKLPSLIPQEESIEPQMPEFVNPFAQPENNEQEGPKFISPQDLLGNYDSDNISTEGEYIKEKGVHIFSFTPSGGIGVYGGNGVQIVWDDDGNWDIQKTRNLGGMLGAGIVGGVNLIAAYKDGYFLGNGEMVYLGFGGGLDVHMGGTYAESVKDEYIAKINFFLNMFTSKD